ncbi:Elongator complex protein 1 [Dioscorea alata]|uniref:Elongator complex protein 1 n=1 Tax=Dioscorea alata TaxID=55571 RepID=A0ACB7UGD2_DIOAL|nr:Elongator complex protein 1 [Dioscorea alata]
MKNLKLSSVFSSVIELQSERENLLLCAFDIENNRIFFASSTNSIYTLQLPSAQNGGLSSKAYLNLEAEEVALEPDDHITDMEYLMEKEALILGTSDGYLLLHSLDPKATNLVGKVEGGIRSISCSPDGALIAIKGGLGQLLVMTHDWDVLYETAVDVQLHNNVVASDASNSSTDNFQSPISWRGDGKYFATLARDNDSLMPELKIWERESGTLHATSGSKSFVGTCLDWMPAGSKVAAVYDRKAEEKSPLIVFFEKNGLERSSFTVDGPVETIIKSLKWNSNSDLLAASISHCDYDAVKIWSFSNNHWYLKQEIRYSKEEGMKFTWDPTNPLHLICWNRLGKVNSYNFIWTTAVTETTIALVIDGNKVLVTPLASALVPPPMSLFHLKFHDAVQDIAFISYDAKSHLAACLSDGSLCIAELPSTDAWEQFEDGEYVVEPSHFDVPLGTLMHLTWLDAHTLLGVSPYQADLFSTASCGEHELDNLKLAHSHGYSLHEIEIVCSENSVPGSINSSGWYTKISKSVPLEKSVIGIASNPAKRHSAFVQINGGSILEHSSEMRAGGMPTKSLLGQFDSDCGFTSSCPWMKDVLICDHGISKPLLFGLDKDGRLHVGRQIICRNCRSFSFYSNTTVSTKQVVTHLLVVTKQDLLFVIGVNEILHGNPESMVEKYSSLQNHGSESKDYITVWERGAKMVGAIHGDEAAVILQTPRGNLECVYPRKLVLASIINALLEERFRDALLMVRRHRIDFNVIVDYCGQQAFIKSAKQFVCQVNNLSHITEFVSSIKNENILETLYKDYVSLPCRDDFPNGGSENPQSIGTQSKVSCVLLAVRTALEEHIPESPARELCILTTLARSEPPALEEALNRIKVTREMELSGVNDDRRKAYPSAEESLKHLLWLTDPEAVFEAALGLYDLNLAAIVALNSQKDPKEFLPFLRELEQLPPVIMRYQIDLKLQRHESALKHIISTGDAHFEDCMNLLKSNPELFPLGLQLLTDLDKRKQVLDAWGDHLFAEKCFEDAATTFLCCSLFQKALKAYRAGSDWRGVLTMAGVLGLQKEEVLQMANDLCEEFQTIGKPSEAAKIALDYCADVDRGVGYFIMAREWDEALRVACAYGRDDLVSLVKDAALDCANTLVTEYKERTEKVGQYLSRYLTVRRSRLTLAAKLHSEDRPIGDPEYDTVSEASSSFSGMSAYTRRSKTNSTASIISSTASKARDIRRQKKKGGGKIRAGSPGEEMGLVDHLKSMSLTESARRDLKSILRALVMTGEADTAKQVQSLGKNFELSQQAAEKLIEDTIGTNIIDESSHTLEHYLKILQGSSHSQILSWQSKVLI